jgi:hypothetical protein
MAQGDGLGDVAGSKAAGSNIASADSAGLHFQQKLVVGDGGNREVLEPQIIGAMENSSFHDAPAS